MATDQDTSSLVAGVYMDRSIVDFQRSCEVHIAEEQRKPNQDNALISLLCDAVRCSRELSACATKSDAALDEAEAEYYLGPSTSDESEPWQPIETAPKGTRILIGGGDCPRVHENELRCFRSAGCCFAGLWRQATAHSLDASPTGAEVMSADAWGVCQKCAALNSLIDPFFGNGERTMREDYEFSIDPETGVFTAQYLARCQECDFTFAFKHEQQAFQRGPRT